VEAGGLSWANETPQPPSSTSSIVLLHIIKVHDSDVKHCNWVKERSLLHAGSRDKHVESNMVAAWLDCGGA